MSAEMNQWIFDTMISMASAVVARDGGGTIGKMVSIKSIIIATTYSDGTPCTNADDIGTIISCCIW